MDNIGTNYLINTIPERESEFVEYVKKIPQFSTLHENLIVQMFKYSKFVKLENNETVIKEGMFDQEIFILIKGVLEVFVTTDGGESKKIDIINQPFSIFGERCILGEQRGATISANGEAYLLGIDLSPLPDVIDGFENPESRLEDSEYSQNLNMYLIFAIVLVERLEKLIMDQYKLKLKIDLLINSSQFGQRNQILAKIFDKFCDSSLPSSINSKKILKDIFIDRDILTGSLNKILAVDPVDSRNIHLELINQKFMGKFDNYSDILLEIIEKFIDEAQKNQEFLKNSKTETDILPPLTDMSGFLNKIYDHINSLDILLKPLSREQFLKGIIFNSKFAPSYLMVYLRTNRFIKEQLKLAYTTYIFCQNAIYLVTEVNGKIAAFVNYLLTLHSPTRQNTQRESKVSLVLLEVVEKLVELAEIQFSKQNPEKKEEKPEPPGQNNIDDLLSQFNM